MPPEQRRPNPDQLLEQVTREEEKKRRGCLKIFFGAAPGVGKTYAMLEAARRVAAEGVDIVAGIVETHGRVETQALLEGMEILPRKTVSYRGTNQTEFDLDAAIRRKPQLLLVDELAHTNAPESRHKKRWQDVQELLTVGIDVYTTLNVQHLESLNDVVAQITGVTVRETVPDAVVEDADEIEIVDLPPDDLLQRLKEGKVYVPHLAARAIESFFRKGNLIALRELALRRTAEQVDGQMRNYRDLKRVHEVWPAGERILVCIGPNPRSIRLIRAAKRMAAGLKCPWICVNVEAPGKVRETEDDLKKLAEHMRLAESLGGETVTLPGYDAADEILAFARERNVSKIIIGKPTHARWKDKLFGSLLDKVVRGSGEIDVYVITGESAEAPPASSRSGRGRLVGRLTANDATYAIGAVAGSTFIGYLLIPRFTLTDVAMVYLLGTVLASLRTSRAGAFLVSLAAVGAFDFFFVQPPFTLAVSDIRFVITFGVMFVTAYVTSGLTVRIREQREAARLRERRVAALYQLTRELVHERDVEKMAETVIRHVGDLLHVRGAVFLKDEPEGLRTAVSSRFEVGDREMAVVRWVFEHGEKAGAGTDTLPGSNGTYLPLKTSSGIMGVLGLLGENGKTEELERGQVMDGFANQLGMALERAFLAEEAQLALLRAEAESLRNTLLSSVSHDLRTPLTAITGAASTLLHQGEKLEEPDQKELFRTIHEEAEQLNHIIRNVLDMSRLEAGQIRLRKEPQVMEEIIGGVLERMTERLGNREIQVDVPEDLPLVECDGFLIAQTLTNLLENAVKYTPAGTPVDIFAHRSGDRVIVEVGDRGPGLPAGMEERIFGKFVKGREGTAGAGLGLAICRAAVELHGGTMRAENRPAGGAVFSFEIPVGESGELPPYDQEEAGEPEGRTS